MTEKKKKRKKHYVTLASGKRVEVDVHHTWIVRPVDMREPARGYSDTSLKEALNNFGWDWDECEAAEAITPTKECV